jgi:hypothetical protein
MRVSILTLLALLVATGDAFVTRHSALSPLLRGGSSLKAHDLTSDQFAVGVLGDLHIDPRYMEDYEIGRTQWMDILNQHKSSHSGNVALVSLGDLGESKSVRPKETNELFAGTTECHQMAADYLGSFGVPYEVVGGNHGAYQRT